MFFKTCCSTGSCHFCFFGRSDSPPDGILATNFFLVSVFLRLLSDGPESESVGDVVDASLSGDVVDGVRSGDSGVGVAGLLLGGVDVAVAVVVVAELILKKSTSFS